MSLSTKQKTLVVLYILMDGEETFNFSVCNGHWVTDITANDLLRILQVLCTFVFEYIDCIVVSEYHALDW